MNYKLIALGGTAVLSFGRLAYLRYKRRKEGWTVLEKVLFGVGTAAVIVTVVVATQDYNKAKSALEAAGKIATDQEIVNNIDLSSMSTLGDIAKEFNLSPQKAKHLIKNLNINHAGEVIRTGFDNGWHYCKVFGPEAADLIRKTLSTV